MPRSPRPRQLQIDFPNGHGGPRRGSGRKRQGARRRVAHRARPFHRKDHPVHVTIRRVTGLPSFRTKAAGAAILRAFTGGRQRFGFRLVHWSVMTNHMHLLVEADDRDALSRGMKGLQVRLARALNGVWNRKGQVFDDRFHAHVLQTPREVRHALVYVLHNLKKHRRLVQKKIDEWTSGRTLDGWRERVKEAQPRIARTVVEAASWLLRRGWRRHGLISIHDRPDPSPNSRTP